MKKKNTHISKHNFILFCLQWYQKKTISALMDKIFFPSCFGRVRYSHHHFLDGFFFSDFIAFMAFIAFLGFFTVLGGSGTCCFDSFVNSQVSVTSPFFLGKEWKQLIYSKRIFFIQVIYACRETDRHWLTINASLPKPNNNKTVKIKAQMVSIESTKCAFFIGFPNLLKDAVHWAHLGHKIAECGQTESYMKLKWLFTNHSSQFG